MAKRSQRVLLLARLRVTMARTTARLMATATLLSMLTARRVSSSLAKVKVIVAFPFGGRFVPPEWAIAISVLKFPPGINNAYVFTKGMARAEARTFLCEKAIEAEAEYLLFLDDDTAPPMDAPLQLIMAMDQADADVAACGGIYTTKADPAMPLVYKEEHGGPFWRWKYGEVFECGLVATGCMLIRLSALKDIPKPWFRDILSVEDAKDDPI